ncbi:MAG TPA: DUF6702 family protein [Pirellulaceae bacterium]|jgi:hypothetical protein|nr:DUF6702 family protein [Pirellulaceae bacterium]
MAARLFVLAAIVGVGTFSGSAFAHPFHSSRMELEWNEEAKTIQAAIRVWPADLEAELSEAAGRPFDLARSPGVDEALLALVEKHVLLRDGETTLSGWRWVGKEVGDREAWLYVEMPLAQAPEHLSVSQRLCLFRNDDQDNVIAFLEDGAATERSCRRETPWATRP